MNPTDLGTWLVIAFAVIGGVATLLNVVDRILGWMRPKVPTQTQIVGGAAQIAELQKLESRVEKLEEKVLSKDAFEDYREERGRDVLRLENLIKDLGTRVDQYSSTSYHGRKELHRQVGKLKVGMAYLSASNPGLRDHLRQEGEGE